ncbi:hypothetical protein ABFU27_17205 [Xanthomonas campestris pv. raphani]|uniref:hypothetical protein n=1 Tax=Xanthomonas campestris TaxID=339 RepID=UPI002B234675|nr:hypothetical protein [Xanthomonas campestris]MEA9861303.1 hypothetical protein [Xanthomonas campestris pv. raphani]MEA9941218.1 hypothetical protein [Xanthomonas campestris pv. raphani]
MGKQSRSQGRYDSSAKLPTATALLERTLLQIKMIYEERGAAKKSFEERWLSATKKLQEYGNATGYRHWKEERARPEDELKLFLLTFIKTRKDSAATRKEGHGKWLRQATREVTDIAIGYWVEAKNAADAGEETRMLHALIECHYYIGIINSPLTHSEAMRSQGQKQGLEKRQDLEQAAIEVLTSWLENRPKKVPAAKPRKPAKPFEKEEMIGRLSQEILTSAKYAAAVKAYDKLTTNGKTVQSPLKFRLPDTLFRWATTDAAKHPEFSELADKAFRLLS